MTHMFDPTPVPTGTIVNVSRRLLLKGAVASGTLVLGASLRAGRAMADWATGAGGMPGGTVNDPHVYISIEPSGLVTIITNRSEMGTGVRTSLPMVVADELEADWSRVRVQQAPGDEKKYGNQDTDGSRSRPPFHPADARVRRGDAYDARAGRGQTLGVDPSEVKADNQWLCMRPQDGRRAMANSPRRRRHCRLRRSPISS